MKASVPKATAMPTRSAVRVERQQFFPGQRQGQPRRGRGKGLGKCNRGSSQPANAPRAIIIINIIITIIIITIIIVIVVILFNITFIICPSS